MGERTAVTFRFFFLLLTILVFLSAPPSSFAKDTPTPSAKQIKQNLLKNKKGLADIQKKLKDAKRRQSQDKIKEKQVLSHLQKVDQTLNKLRREKEINTQDLQETRTRSAQLQQEIKSKKVELAQSRQLLKQRLSDLYRMSFRRPFWGGLLNAESFSDLARKLKFELLLAKINERILSQTLQDEARLKKNSALWTGEEKRRQRILASLSHQEKNYSKERKNRTVFLTAIRRQQDLREQTIEDLSEASHKLQGKVSLLLKQAKESKKKQVYVATGKGLKVSRGKIPWPVSGKIISFFGKNKSPEFNVVVDNSGIQIQAPQGTPFRAVSSGTVRFADWFKGYGKLVILDHGQGYYSLYAQASELNVSEGQTVAAGQILGAVGDTGSLVGNSLYFEIRKNGVPQDPLHWLKYRH